jgi:hypothetical protein
MNAAKTKTKPTLHVEVKLKSGDGQAQFTRLDKVGIYIVPLHIYTYFISGERRSNSMASSPVCPVGDRSRGPTFRYTVLPQLPEVLHVLNAMLLNAS